MIFEYLKYRPYLEQKLGRKGSRTGLRKKLAEAIGVHTTFVSQVLLDKAQFSLEQAEAVNAFLGHSKEEGEYFLYLVMRQKAGTKALRERLDEKIQQMRDARLKIKDRLEVKDTIQHEDRVKFYSNYYYGAIHVLVSIEGYQSVEDLSQALRLPRARVQEMVEFLQKLGILVYKGSRLLPGPRHVHLGADTELVLKHHSNWRMHALSSLHFVREDDLHYSACLSISSADAFRVKDSIIDNLKSNVKIISGSKEEAAYVYNIDFYPLLGD